MIETAVYDKYVRWCGRTGPRGPSYPIPVSRASGQASGPRFSVVAKIAALRTDLFLVAQASRPVLHRPGGRCLEFVHFCWTS